MGQAWVDSVIVGLHRARFVAGEPDATRLGTKCSCAKVNTFIIFDVAYVFGDVVAHACFAAKASVTSCNDSRPPLHIFSS